MSDECWILRELLRAAEEHPELELLARSLVTLTHRLVACQEVTLYGPDQIPLASDLSLDAVQLRGPEGQAFALTDRRGASLGTLRVVGVEVAEVPLLELLAEYAGSVLVNAWRSHLERQELTAARERAERLGRWAAGVEPLVETLAHLSAQDEEQLLEQLSTAWLSLTGYELAALRLGTWRWLSEPQGPAWEAEAAAVVEACRRRPLVIDDLAATRFATLAAQHRCLMAVPVGDRGALVLAHSRPGVWERLESQLVWWTASFLDTWLQNLGQARQQQQAARMAALGQLAAGMAHEVNNPLGTILIALRTLQKTASGPMLEAAVAATKRAQEIVEKLLRYSRQDQGSRTRVSLARLVEEAVELLRPQLHLSGVKLILAGGPDLSVSCCPGDIQQVVVNLVLNARDVSPRVAVRTLQEGAWAVLEVLDEGPGLDPALGERVFEPFFTTKPVGQGTGLGLAISRSIASDHGGTLELSNRAQGGAVARLRLPCAI